MTDNTTPADSSVPASSRSAVDRPSGLGEMSLAVHAGVLRDSTQALKTPLVMANSFQLPAHPSEISWSASAPGLYTRNSGHNQIALEQKLATIEGAEEALALASGVAALHAVFFTLLRPGDHVVVSDITYEATWRLMSELLPERMGIEVTFVDTTDLAAVAAALRPTTRLVCVEAIANPTTRVTDIAAIAELTHRVGALLMVDSTFTPPPMYRPIHDGADLVVHSLTKYINGHGDAMGGAVLGRSEHLQAIKADAMVEVGGIISPFNAWQIQRGSVTLPLRMQQHSASAQRLAELLEADPRVAFVAYPGLASHPEHETAARQFGGRGFGGMLAFALDGPPALQDAFVGNLELITSGFSLGHDDSLIVHVSSEGPRVASYPEPFKQYGHLRLSVGIEDASDLCADVAAALDRTLG